MDYLETNWVDGQTPLNASNMNKIEQAIKTLASGGSGLTPDQLNKLNGIEDGAQQNPNFKTINGNEITGTGDIIIEATVSDEVIEQKVTEQLDGLGVATEDWVRNYSLSKNDTYTQAQIHQAILDAQVGGDVAALTDAINRIVEDRLADVELQYRQLDRYYTAQEIGAYKWDEIPQGKGYQFTTEQYRQGYENNIAFTNAIVNANLGGYLRVVFEKGFYPTTGNRQSFEPQAANAQTNKGSYHICPRGVERLAINLNGSTVFHIWDSSIRQPYDERVLDETNITTIRNTNIFNWSGRIFSFPDARYVRLENGIIRGDMYYRTYNQDPNEERRVEFGTGVFNSPNARFIKLKHLDISGFRGDGVSGSPRGYTLYNQTTMTWSKGGIDANGADAEEVGAYRTPVLTLSDKTIYDNAIQLMTSGTRRSIGFRQGFADAYFYDVDGALISTEKVAHAEFIYLPTGTVSCRFVARGDERTDDVVDFGHTLLVTGTSDKFHIEDCTIHYNMRGGISNVCSDFSAERVTIHTIGNTISKYGDLAYFDATKYAINFEDVFVRRVYLNELNIKDAYKPFICITRDFTITNSTFMNCASSGVAVYADKLVVQGNTFNEAGFTIDWTNVTGTNSVAKQAIVSDNKVFGLGGHLWRFNIAAPHTLVHSDNIVLGAIVDLEGNIISSGNVYEKINGQFTNAVFFKNVTRLDDVVLDDVGTNARNFRMHEKRRSRTNKVQWNSTYSATPVGLNIVGDYVESKAIFHTPVNFTCDQQRDLDIYSRYRDGFIDKHDFYKSTWHGARFRIGNYSGGTRTYNDMQVTYKECEFSFFNLTSHTLDANKETTFTINFEDCVFNFDDLYFLYDVDTRISLGSLILNFKRCIFEASSQKDIRIVKTGINTQINTIASTLTDCEFENVVNVDGITTVI